MYMVFGITLVWAIGWFVVHAYRRRWGGQTKQSMLQLELAGDLVLVGALVLAAGMLVHDYSSPGEPAAAHRSCIALAFKQGFPTRESAVPFLDDCMRNDGTGWVATADGPGCSGWKDHYKTECWVSMQPKVGHAQAPHYSSLLPD